MASSFLPAGGCTVGCVPIRRVDRPGHARALRRRSTQRPARPYMHVDVANHGAQEVSRRPGETRHDWPVPTCSALCRVRCSCCNRPPMPRKTGRSPLYRLVVDTGRTRLHVVGGLPCKPSGLPGGNSPTARTEITPTWSEAGAAAGRHGALIAPTWDGFTQRQTDSDDALLWASDGSFYSVLPCVPPADGSHAGRARKGPTGQDSASLCRHDAGSTFRRSIRAPLMPVAMAGARVHVGSR